MDNEPAHRRAALTSGAHGTKCDSPQRQLEIGRGGDDRGVVAAEFEDRFAETARHALADGAAHACRTGCRDHRQTRIVDERSEEHTSELQSLMHISYAVFCLKK